MEGASGRCCISQLAASVAEIMGIAPPQCAQPPMDCLLEKAKAALEGRKAQRVLLYNPDAIALWLYAKYTAVFFPVMLRSSLAVPLLSVMPSVTPVCFASMYTGAEPSVHGIQTYTKPVLKTDTLFDALLREGKRPAIVCTEGDSISRIFLERDMDYFFYTTPEACNGKAKELIQRNEHDLICVYNGNYDAAMHRYSPEGTEALAQLAANAADYAALVDCARQAWAGYDCFLGFCPDHGCHAIDGGLGSHGLDMPEDMEIIHFYDFQSRRESKA